MGNICYSQVPLVECKWVVKEEKMLKLLLKNIEISSEESDKEESDEENSDKENYIEE